MVDTWRGMRDAMLGGTTAVVVIPQLTGEVIIPDPWGGDIYCRAFLSCTLHREAAESLLRLTSGAVMRYNVVYNGDIVGHAEMTLRQAPGSTSLQGTMVPSPSYENIRAVCQAPFVASHAGVGAEGLGDLGSDVEMPMGDFLRLLAAVHDLQLQLHDESGVRVDTLTPVIIHDLNVPGLPPREDAIRVVAVVHDTPPQGAAAGS